MKFPSIFPPLHFNQLNWDLRAPDYIPEIDYTKLSREFHHSIEPSPGTEKDKLIAVFDNNGPGVFYLKNPPISEDRIQSLVNSTRAFLNSPEKDLESYHVNAGAYVGYSPLGFESTEAAVNQGLGLHQKTPADKDQCHKFSWELNNPKNKWPSKELEDLSINFTRCVLENTKQMLKWIVELYPPEDEQLEAIYSVIENAQPVTRHLLYSDVDKANSSKTKMHQHADISLMTASFRIPSANGFNALHYKINDKFRPTPTLRHCESLHVGEPFAAFYQGRRKMNSPVHYVAMPPDHLRGKGSEHTTLVTFVNPGDNARIPTYERSFYKTYHEQNSDGTYANSVEKLKETFIPQKSKL